MRGSSPRMRVEVSPRIGSAGDGMADAQGRGIDQHNGHAGALGAAVRPGMVGAALTMTSLGLAPTRRGHAEHTAALLNSSGLWVSSRTRGGRGWHAAAASGRFSIGPPMQLVERDSSRGASCSTTATPRRCAMTSSFVTKLAVTLELALTTAATVSFAQSRPQSCIPHYDASGAQEAPYC